jgi:hypothetical protein
MSPRKRVRQAVAYLDRYLSLELPGDRRSAAVAYRSRCLAYLAAAGPYPQPDPETFMQSLA